MHSLRVSVVAICRSSLLPGRTVWNRAASREPSHHIRPCCGLRCPLLISQQRGRMKVRRPVSPSLIPPPRLLAPTSRPSTAPKSEWQPGGKGHLQPRSHNDGGAREAKGERNRNEGESACLSWGVWESGSRKLELENVERFWVQLRDESFVIAGTLLIINPQKLAENTEVILKK